MRAWWQMLNTKGRIHLNLPSCANIAGLAVGKRIQKISCLVYKGRIRIASNSLVTASHQKITWIYLSTKNLSSFQNHCPTTKAHHPILKAIMRLKGICGTTVGFLQMESCLKAETARSKVQWCQKTSLHSTPIYTVQVRVTEYSMSRNTHRNAKSMGIPKAFVHSINCCLCKNSEDKIKSLMLNIFYFQLQESAMVVLLIAHYF